MTDSTLDLDLPTIARDVLVMCGAARTGLRGDADALSVLLAERGFSPRASVLAFEVSYGGLRLPESALHAASLEVGPFAFHSVLPGYRSYTPDLVPVMATSNDIV